jgi:hypothetical protein
MHIQTTVLRYCKKCLKMYLITCLPVLVHSLGILKYRQQVLLFSTCYTHVLHFGIQTAEGHVQTHITAQVCICIRKYTDMDICWPSRSSSLHAVCLMIHFGTQNIEDMFWEQLSQSHVAHIRQFVRVDTWHLHIHIDMCTHCCTYIHTCLFMHCTWVPVSQG